MLRVNTKAPDFSLQDQDGTSHSLADYKGKFVLIYFYPKDDTPGCTVEACSLRDSHPAFEKLNAVVLGVSADSVKSHIKFADKHKLPFTLLADPEKTTIKKYKAWGKKKFMGKEYMGIIRSSYLVGRDGKIVKVYKEVKPAVHADQVLADLEKLNSKIAK